MGVFPMRATGFSFHVLHFFIINTGAIWVGGGLDARKSSWHHHVVSVSLDPWTCYAVHDGHSIFDTITYAFCMLHAPRRPKPRHLANWEETQADFCQSIWWNIVQLELSSTCENRAQITDLYTLFIWRDIFLGISSPTVTTGQHFRQVRAPTAIAWRTKLVFVHGQLVYWTAG